MILKGADCESLEVFAEAGSPVVLPCKCSPQTVSPSVIWTNGKGSIWKMQRGGLQFRSLVWASRVECPHSQFESGDYSLHIKSVRKEDAGLYDCTLGLDNTRLVKTTIMLRVMKASVSPVDPMMGRTVTIGCSVSPWPPGARVEWRLNNNPYGTTDDFKQNNDVTVKVADNVKGKWTCVVSYKGKEGQASTVLDFKGIIQPAEDNTKIYAAVGSAVRLPCVFSSGLTSSDIIWKRFQNNTTSAMGPLPLSFSPPSTQTSESDRSAVLNEVNFEDEGLYSCSGMVEGQRLDRKMQLVTAKVNVNTKKDETTLTCQLSNTSNITRYEWVLVKSDLNGSRFVASVQKVQTVTLSPLSEGEWTCHFYGKQGILGNVTYQIQHMAGLSGLKSGGSSHNTAVLVGLSFLLLILLLILAQMYKNHQRRKRAFQYPALETIIHHISVEREMRENSQARK